jgi:hypothetical protein
VSSVLFIYLNEKWPKIGSITCNHVGLCVHVFHTLLALWSPLVSFSHVSLHINFTSSTNKKYKNKPTYQLLVSAFPSSNQHVDIRLLEIVSHINGLDHFSHPSNLSRWFKDAHRSQSQVGPTSRTAVNPCVHGTIRTCGCYCKLTSRCNRITKKWKKQRSEQAPRLCQGISKKYLSYIKIT